MDNSEFHEVANIFPLMDETALNELAADIAANGLRDAIWRHRDGRIVDGRNRWLACRKAGVDCRHQTFEDDDAKLVAFVVSRNLHRRHLTTDQRAAIAADIATMRQGARTDLNSIERMSQPEAAKLLNVSSSSTRRATTVKRAAPELHEKVKAGEMKAGAARRQIQKRNATSKSKDAKSQSMPDSAPRLRVVHDREDELVAQVYNLMHRLREVAEKIEPEILYGRMPNRLMHNLDISLEKATDFLIGLRDTHRAQAAEKKNAAG